MGQRRPADPAPGSERLRGLLLTTSGALFAALYLLPFRAAVARVPARAVALPTLLTAALLNTLWLLPRLMDRRQRPRPVEGGGLALDLTVAALLGLLSALGNEAAAQALARIDPGLAAVVLRTQVVFVALGGVVLLGEGVTRRFWLGVGIALAGMILLRAGGLRAPEATLAGMAWSLVAAASFGAMQVTVRRAIRRMDPLRVNALRLWLAAALLAPLPGRAAALAEADAVLWALAGAAALAGPLLSRLLLMEGLRYIPAAQASLALFTQPLFAYLLAALVFGVLPTGLELAGCAVVLLGVGLPLSGKINQ